ncbi:MAG: spore germination protein [Oscillospiraceae bacterium]
MKNLKDKLSTSLSDNHINIRSLLNNTGDLIIKTVEVNNSNGSLIMCEGMVSLNVLAEFLIEPLNKYTFNNNNPKEMLDDICKNKVWSADQKKVFTYKDVFSMIMSGFAVLLIDGCEEGVCFGLQGFNIRSISEPSTEANVKGSRESFIEAIKINITMIRRRMKTNTLMFDTIKIGDISNTDVTLVYLTDKVSSYILKEIKDRLKSVNLDLILESGYLQPFLENTKKSIFSGIGYTERPDTLCGKIKEGRVAILVDGTPFSIIVPYLFNEHFQTMDDYSNRPFYASFVRVLKYLGFLVSIFLPGLYVAISQYHLELLPKSFLQTVIIAQQESIFPIMIEAIVIFLIYEILKEAGLRLPRAVGHTVSIIGALLIGESAVNSGIIGAPMVMIVALTAISSFIVPSLYEQVTILRFLLIILGGLFGLFGFTVGIIFFIINITAIDSFSIPFTTPFIPFKFSLMKDVLIRSGWKKLSKDNIKVQNLPGSLVKNKVGEKDDN